MREHFLGKYGPIIKSEDFKKGAFSYRETAVLFFVCFKVLFEKTNYTHTYKREET